MKHLPNLGNTKVKTLRNAIVAALTAGGVALAGTAFGDGIVTYNSLEETLHIPKVHVGHDQYEVKLERKFSDDWSFNFVVTDMSLVSRLTFKDRENPEFSRSLTLTELVEQFPPQEIEVYDPTENRNKTFRGIPTTKVFDFVYGENWREREEIQTTAQDGYQPSFPVERYLKYDNYIAYEDVNRPHFILVKASDAKYVELGPFWSIWDNITYPELKASVSYGWTWQLINFELVSFADVFADSVPPAESPENVKRGFLNAREFCMICHKVNGDGGKKGPELIKTGIVEEHTTDEIKKYITDINAAPVSGMVLRDEVPDREQVADDIITYLKAMDANK